MADVVDFPPLPEQPEFLFAYHELDRVIVEGREIPRLRGKRQEDGTVMLCIDGRFCVEFPADVARQAAWLLAQALAVGAGYSHLGAADKGKPFAPISTEFASPEVSQ